MSCVQNPMIGTEFEALEYAEPQLYPAPSADRRRVLVLGAGVAGIEAARVLKGRGHEVEVWELQERPGGQVPLAVASPDKREVEPVWGYRWQTVQALGVPVRMGVRADAGRIRAYAPDHVILATGSQPARPPLDLAGLDAGVRVRHAWEVLADLDAARAGLRVTIVGGGMVGAETADALRVRGAEVTVLELQPSIAAGMARNNRYELVERLAADGVRLLANCRILGVRGPVLEVQVAGQPVERLPIGDWLVFATGPRPALDALVAVEESGVPSTRVGDCSAPGDFLAAIRDAWMAALALDVAPHAAPAPVAARSH